MSKMDQMDDRALALFPSISVVGTHLQNVPGGKVFCHNKPTFVTMSCLSSPYEANSDAT